MKRIYDFSRNPAKRNYTVSDLKEIKTTPKKLQLAQNISINKKTFKSIKKIS